MVVVALPLVLGPNKLHTSTSVIALFWLLVGLMSTNESSSAFAPRQSLTVRPETAGSAVSATAPVATRRSLAVGFLGCGTIASAIATGLVKQEKVDVTHVSVTRRSTKRSTALATTFPDLISVHDDNQEIVDQSDVIFVTVLPEQASELLRSLTFDPLRHCIISLVSTATIQDLCRDAKLPPDRVFKMICLPAVANCNGVCLLLTPQGKDPPLVLELCQSLGGCVQATTNDEMSVLMVTSGLMGTFYGLLRSNSNFLQSHGIPKDDANFLVGRLYQNMLDDASAKNADWDEMIAEQTPGGLNEQGLRNANELGVLDAYDKVQQALLSRILGQSDGSL
jgi:pyrroline-5-carboxylate reductase